MTRVGAVSTEGDRDRAVNKELERERENYKGKGNESE
jgi:hypothetical protein